MHRQNLLYFAAISPCNFVPRLLLALLFFPSISAIAQDLKPDTAFVRISMQNTRNLYAGSMQGESDLYNGTDYPEYNQLKLGQHPYFKMDDWTDGAILYGGQWYENVGLLYDICREKVVIEHYYNRSMMELVDEKIGRFSLLHHTFVHLSSDKSGNLQAGLYDLLYDGNTKVYAKRVKLMESTIQDHHKVYYFSEKTRYYILKNKTYYPVSNKASVLSVFEDRKREVKQLLGEKKIRFRPDREKAIAWMAEFYDVTNK